MRVASKITLTGTAMDTLKRLSRSGRTPARVAHRAEIVLLAADGLENQEIGRRLSITRQKAGRWRERYARSGLALDRDGCPTSRPFAEHRQSQKGAGREEDFAGAPTRSHPLEPADHVGGRWPQPIQRGAHLARAWVEASLGQDLQAFQRSALCREAGRYHRPVCEPARARHRLLL
jgi:DNA-binding CsgD family transcriptional regulator